MDAFPHCRGWDDHLFNIVKGIITCQAIGEIDLAIMYHPEVQIIDKTTIGSKAGGGIVLPYEGDLKRGILRGCKDP